MEPPGSNKPSLLERLSTLLLREPEDREQLVELLHSAYERNLLDADALSMMEGVMQVSERQVREIMIPRAICARGIIISRTCRSETCITPSIMDSASASSRLRSYAEC